MQASEQKRKLSPAAWTVIVLAVGLVLGVLLALLPRPTRHHSAFTGSDLFQTLEDIDVAVATVSLALLVTLLYVYAKTQSETRARFALGLFFVLGALLFQAMLTYPIFFAAFGRVSLGGLSPFVLAADLFKATAFGAFLYLSLQ